MAERTLSIVIDVDGVAQATSEIRRVRSALDDMADSRQGLQQLARQSREAGVAFRDLTSIFDPRGSRGSVLASVEDFFQRIARGARDSGTIFKQVWRDAADYVSKLLAGNGTAGLAGSLLSAGGGILGGLVGSSNRGLSLLGGLGSGAITGFSFGGPVGAVVGGLIGGIAGLFGGGSGKQKEYDAAIANQGFSQLRQILDDYNHFRRDFAASVDAANRIWAQMQSQWKRSQSATSQRPYFDAILRSMQSTEDERNRRRQMQAMMPVPQFANGGLVSGSGSAGTLAVVHPGEFVMSRKAVEQMGVNTLASLNQSGGRGVEGLSISLEPASAQSLGEILKRNPQALEEGLLAVLRRGGAVSRALRA